MSGIKLAVLYGIIPHQLGLCGSTYDLAQKTLKRYLAGTVSRKQVRAALKRFKGAYPYYRLIARANRIKNIFDEKVVSAYWLGNALLDKVRTGDLRQMIINDFSGQGLLSRPAAENLAANISKNSKPHHSFHVLKIGAVTGSIDFAGNTKLKDNCRVGWGKIKKFHSASGRPKSEKIIVAYQPLVGKKTIRLGQPVKKEIIWDKNIIPILKIGDWVSFHWRTAIQKLTKKDVNNLKKYTRNALNCL